MPSMDVVVQPGVNWMELNKQIAGDGLFLPMDPSPTASVGGMVSTNCRHVNPVSYSINLCTGLVLTI